MKLDLTSFKKAVSSLNEALAEYKKNTDNKFIKDSVIQRFEYTYELSHKMIKRFIEMSEFSSANVDELVFSVIIRTANEKGLLLGDLRK